MGELGHVAVDLELAQEHNSQARLNGEVGELEGTLGQKFLHVKVLFLCVLLVVLRQTRGQLSQHRAMALKCHRQGEPLQGEHHGLEEQPRSRRCPWAWVGLSAHPCHGAGCGALPGEAAVSSCGAGSCRTTCFRCAGRCPWEGGSLAKTSGMWGSPGRARELAPSSVSSLGPLFFFLFGSSVQPHGTLACRVPRCQGRG